LNPGSAAARGSDFLKSRLSLLSSRKFLRAHLSRGVRVLMTEKVKISICSFELTGLG